MVTPFSLPSSNNIFFNVICQDIRERITSFIVPPPPEAPSLYEGTYFYPCVACHCDTNKLSCHRAYATLGYKECCECVYEYICPDCHDANTFFLPYCMFCGECYITPVPSPNNSSDSYDSDFYSDSGSDYDSESDSDY